MPARTTRGALDSRLDRPAPPASLRPMSFPVRFWSGACASLLLAACAPHRPPSYHLSHHPDDTHSRPLRHYPVARQGNLTAWLTSDHVMPASDWLYAPGDPNPKYRIVGTIRASAMPERAKHDGSFLVVAGYEGPLYELWQGTDGEGRLFIGPEGWIPVRLHQDDAVNTWLKVSPRRKIGGWSGFPVVIGNPDQPEAIAGAMWYKSNTEATHGGTTSTRMLRRWLGRLRLADYVKP
jgi:hypothetical protein